MANLADLAVGISADLNKFEAGMNKVPAKAGEAADGVVQKFRAMAPKLEAAAKAGAVAAGAAIVVGATEGLEREAVGDKLAAQLRLSEGESKIAGEVAGGLYANAYGDSLEEVNAAVGAVVGGELARLGDGEGVERLSAKALDLAKTFDLDIGQAVGNAGVLVRSGLAKDADEAFDLIAASSQKVAPAVRDELGDATKEYAKFFGQLGVSGSEALGLLAAADDQFELDKTGDAIKELTDRATNMSATSVAAFDTMGLDAEDMADRVLAGGDTARGAFDDIVDGLLGMENPAAQAEAAIALFGEPMVDLGTGEIPDFLSSLDSMGDSLGDVEGRAAEMGDTLNDNASTRIEGFRRKVEGMLAKVVEAPGILGDMAVAAGGMGQVLEPLGPAIAGVGFIFRDKLAAMGSAMASGAASAASWAASMAAQGAKAAASMAMTAGRIVASYAMMGVQALAAAAKVALSWAIAFGPIALVVAAVVGLVVAIVKNWDTIKAAISTAWEWIKSVTAAVWDAIVSALGAVWDAITGAVSATWDAITGAISTAWNTIQSLIDGALDAVWSALSTALSAYLDLWRTVWTTIIDAVRSAMSTVLTTIVDKGAEVLSWFAALPGRILDKIGDVATLLGDKARSMIGGFLLAVGQKWLDVNLWLLGLAGRILDGIGDLAGILVSAGRALMDGLLAGIRAGFESVKGFVGGIADTVASLKGPLPYDRRVLVDNGLALMSGLDAGMRSGLEGVLDTARGVAPSIADTIGTQPFDIAANVRPAAGMGGGRLELSPQSLEQLAVSIASAVERGGETDWHAVARTFGRETAREQQRRSRQGATL